MQQIIKINNLKNKIIGIFVRCSFIFGVFFTLTHVVYAIETYIPLEDITIGEFIYNDDYTATADDCTIDIYSPSLVSLVSTTMIDEGDVGVTGWHYYEYTVPATEGKYPTYITCGSAPAGDLFKLDKSFIVKAPIVTDASIAAAVDTNTSASVSGAVTTINSNTDNKTGSLATTLSSLPATIWGYTSRTLTAFGSLVADVWNVLSSSLTTDNTIGKQVATNLDTTISSVSDNWSVKMGNVDRVQAGYNYRTKVFILNGSATPTEPFSTPTVTLYDTTRNVIVSDIPMTFVSTGVYEYTYTVASGATQGLWETIASTEIESGKVIKTNDYWEVASSPAQVIINSVTASNINSINGNVTITNEGLTGYEYDYEWCIVSDLSNICGGTDDAFFASAAKWIDPGDSWNTTLTANVSTIGTYYFKLRVFFGADSSSASRVFTVSNQESGGGSSGSGGSVPITLLSSCNGADFNIDGLVDSTDFSILLYFWNKLFPFQNKCVDINADKKVDSIDFSIMLYQWGKKPI